MNKTKECLNCEFFGQLSDWQTVEYAELIKQDNGTGFKDGKPVTNTTVGQQNSVLNEMAKNGAGFGKVYTVCKKHKIISYNPMKNSTRSSQTYYRKKNKDV